MNLKQAGDIVTRIDQERAEFVRHHFRVDVHDPTRCDLTLNMEHFSIDQAVEAILAVRATMKGITSKAQ
jgi:hypothetical protein